MLKVLSVFNLSISWNFSFKIAHATFSWNKIPNTINYSTIAKDGHLAIVGAKRLKWWDGLQFWGLINIMGEQMGRVSRTIFLENILNEHVLS